MNCEEYIIGNFNNTKIVDGVCHDAVNLVDNLYSDSRFFLQSLSFNESIIDIVDECFPNIVDDSYIRGFNLDNVFIKDNSEILQLIKIYLIKCIKTTKINNDYNFIIQTIIRSIHSNKNSAFIRDNMIRELFSLIYYHNYYSNNKNINILRTPIQEIIKNARIMLAYTNFTEIFRNDILYYYRFDNSYQWLPLVHDFKDLESIGLNSILLFNKFVSTIDNRISYYSSVLKKLVDNVICYNQMNWNDLSDAAILYILDKILLYGLPNKSDPDDDKCLIVENFLLNICNKSLNAANYVLDIGISYNKVALLKIVLFNCEHKLVITNTCINKFIETNMCEIFKNSNADIMDVFSFLICNSSNLNISAISKTLERENRKILVRIKDYKNDIPQYIIESIITLSNTCITEDLVNILRKYDIFLDEKIRFF